MVRVHRVVHRGGTNVFVFKIIMSACPKIGKTKLMLVEVMHYLEFTVNIQEFTIRNYFNINIHTDLH